MSYNFINLDFKWIIKLFKRGKIEKIYLEFYKLAENLAIHETTIYEEKLLNIEKINSNEDMMKIWDKIFKKREERLEYHMEKMRKLLLLHLKESDKDNII